MGCITSKQSSGGTETTLIHDNAPGAISRISSKNPSSHNRHRVADGQSLGDSISGIWQLRKSKKRTSSSERDRLRQKSGLYNRNVEAQEAAAGWPTWLIFAAAEAIQGWVPLRAEAFEKLEKIGQGTYSSVFRAREVGSGKLFALKKVKFDKTNSESIRFMAREIVILRKLDHPNVMKLEGIITSRMSNSIYLVFEYMEHDLAGLSSNSNVKFTESQIKCYMQQLLRGLEHCHTCGVIHRDIKASNILLNNEGVLKIGDFGLANVITPSNRNRLTSRVVTLWYRAPELLMGSTSYGFSVDLWSVGCVFAEIQLGKPILKGRTEIEQLHKIYKLCGSPSEELWKKLKLPRATMFKPLHSYKSNLRERCNRFSTTALNLLETFLSIEPEKRGTASAALNSEYFATKPYACNPSTLPQYPPNKEMDAKYREEMRRKKIGMMMKDAGAPKNPRKHHERHRLPETKKDLDSFGALSMSFKSISNNQDLTQSRLLRPKLTQTSATGSEFAWAGPKKHNYVDSASAITSMSGVSRFSLAFATRSFTGSDWDLSPRDGSEEVAEKIKDEKEEYEGTDTISKAANDRPQIYFGHVLDRKGDASKAQELDFDRIVMPKDIEIHPAHLGSPRAKSTNFCERTKPAYARLLEGRSFKEELRIGDLPRLAWKSL